MQLKLLQIKTSIIGTSTDMKSVSLDRFSPRHYNAFQKRPVDSLRKQPFLLALRRETSKIRGTLRLLSVKYLFREADIA